MASGQGALDETVTLYGVPRCDAPAVSVIPAPCEATTSYGRGTAGAPAAILRASQQVDLCDREVGPVWQAGIALDEPDPRLAGLDLVRDPPGRVNEAGASMAQILGESTERVFERGAIPAVLGGEHSVALGPILAAAGRFPERLGLLVVDAHLDLREAYQGLEYSHASVLFNVLERTDGLSVVVHVGARDACDEEWSRAADDPRLLVWPDDVLARRTAEGAAWATLAREIVADLPHLVWVSFDIDGLDPSLCPGTGTPVPGGLTWHQACGLLRILGESGRRIVGFDLCEVGAGELDANVGARLLYKLAGWAVATRDEREDVHHA